MFGSESVYCSIPTWLSYFSINLLIAKLFFYRDRDYLYASFLVFFYVFLFLAPVLQVSNGYFPWFDSYTQEDVDMGWWVTFFCIAGFELGYVLKKPVGSSNIQVDKKVLTRKGVVLLFWLAVLVMTLGVLSIGLPSLFLPRNELSEILSAIAGGNASKVMILTAIMRVPAVIVLIVLVYDIVIKFKSGQYKNGLHFQWLIICSLFLIVTIVNNPISTPRFWVGTIFLSLYLVYLVSNGRARSGKWFLINVLILLLAFPVMDIFRKSLDGDIVNAFLSSAPQVELVKSPDFDAFQQQVNTVITVESRGYAYGKQAVSSLFFFIPRSIWQNKSEPTGVLVADTLGYDFLNLSAPIGAELFMDGGLIAVFIGMALIGLLYKKLYILSLSGNGLIVPFYYFFCAYQTYFLRGSMMTVIAFVVVSILFLSIIYWYKNIFFESIKGGK